MLTGDQRIIYSQSGNVIAEIGPREFARFGKFMQDYVLARQPLTRHGETTLIPDLQKGMAMKTFPLRSVTSRGNELFIKPRGRQGIRIKYHKIPFLQHVEHYRQVVLMRQGPDTKSARTETDYNQ